MLVAYFNNIQFNIKFSLGKFQNFFEVMFPKFSRQQFSLRHFAKT